VCVVGPLALETAIKGGSHFIVTFLGVSQQDKYRRPTGKQKSEILIRQIGRTTGHPFFLNHFRGLFGRPHRSLTVKMIKIIYKNVYDMKRRKTYAHLSIVSYKFLALSHNTTGSSGKSTPKLDLAEQIHGTFRHFAENIRGLGFRL
jgi:hypothetical protein